MLGFVLCLFTKDIQSKGAGWSHHQVEEADGLYRAQEASNMLQLKQYHDDQIQRKRI